MMTAPRQKGNKLWVGYNPLFLKNICEPPKKMCPFCNMRNTEESPKSPWWGAHWEEMAEIMRNPGDEKNLAQLPARSHARKVRDIIRGWGFGGVFRVIPGRSRER